MFPILIVSNISQVEHESKDTSAVGWHRVGEG